MGGCIYDMLGSVFNCLAYFWSFLRKCNHLNVYCYVLDCFVKKKMFICKLPEYGWFRETINTISGNNKFYSPPGGLYKNSLVKTINTEYIKINKNNNFYITFIPYSQCTRRKMIDPVKYIRELFQR